MNAIRGAYLLDLMVTSLGSISRYISMNCFKLKSKTQKRVPEQRTGFRFNVFEGTWEGLSEQVCFIAKDKGPAVGRT